MALKDTQTVPIAELNPDLVDADDCWVLGVVTLIWPYASSRKSMSLLLVEQDFRLRARRGQVRVCFNGASAKAVSQGDIGSGDELLLNLKGARWERDESMGSTPGKAIDWKLQYRDYLRLEIRRAHIRPVVLEVDHPPPSPEPSLEISTVEKSPSFKGHSHLSSGKSHVAPVNGTQKWSVPAFLKRANFLTSSYHHFWDEEEFPDNDRLKKSRFGRGSGQWRFIERTPSPVKETPGEENEVGTPPRPQGQASADNPPSESPGVAVEQHGREPGLQYEQLDSSKGSNRKLEANERERDENTIYFIDRTRLEKGAGEDRSNHDIPWSPGRDAGSEPSTGQGDLLIEDALTQAQPVTEVQETQFSQHGQSKAVHISKALSPQASILSVGSSLSSSSDPDEEAEGEGSKTGDGQLVAYSGPFSSFGFDGSISWGGRKDTVDRAATDETATAPGLGHASTQGETIPREIDAERYKGNDGGTDAEGGIEDVAQSDVDLEFDQQAAQEHSSVPMPYSEQLESVSQDNRSVPEDCEGLMPGGKVVRDMVADAETCVVSMDSDGMFPTQSVTNPDVSLPTGHGEREEVQRHLSHPEQLASGHDKLEATVGLTRASEVDIISFENEGQDAQRPPGSPLPNSLSSIEGYTGGAQPGKYQEESRVEPNEWKPIDLLDEAIEQAAANDVEQTAGPDIDMPGNIFEEARRDKSPKTIEQEARATPREHGSPDTAPTPNEAADSVDETIHSGRTWGEESGQDSENGMQPFAELPATVPDSAGAVSNQQLITPSTTQRTSFATQASIVSLQSVPNDDTLPTPWLTQGTSADIVVPPDLPIVPESSEVGPRNTFRSNNVVPPSQDDQCTPGPPAPPPITSDKTRSPLIERLKAMKRVSQHSPRTRLSAGAIAVSPWFAPRRLPVAVADSEAETGDSSSDNDDQSAMTGKLSTAVTPPEKAREKTLVPSSPERTDVLSEAASPRYLPPPRPETVGGFRTKLAYFVPLAGLPSYFGTITDVLAVAISSTSISRAPSGRGDFTQAIYLTDPSTSATETPVTKAQIFRPSQRCFPEVRVGDALLLRDFKVQSFQQRISLLSTDTSAWAIFRPSTAVQVRGPPVEYGAEERGFARGNWRWWGSLSAVEQKRLQASLPKVRGGGSALISEDEVAKGGRSGCPPA
ncbi:MAG: hypothetical protein Q9163_005105 [Psora crenata]